MKTSSKRDLLALGVGTVGNLAQSQARALKGAFQDSLQAARAGQPRPLLDPSRMTDLMQRGIANLTEKAQEYADTRPYATRETLEHMFPGRVEDLDPARVNNSVARHLGIASYDPLGVVRGLDPSGVKTQVITGYTAEGTPINYAGVPSAGLPLATADRVPHLAHELGHIQNAGDMRFLMRHGFAGPLQSDLQEVLRQGVINPIIEARAENSAQELLRGTPSLGEPTMIGSLMGAGRAALAGDLEGAKLEGRRLLGQTAPYSTYATAATASDPLYNAVGSAGTELAARGVAAAERFKDRLMSAAGRRARKLLT